VYDIVLLSLAEGGGSTDTCGSACGSGCGSPASDQAAPDRAASGRTVCAPRVPVLACADALRAAGARVEMITAASDADIDAVIERFDAGPRADQLTWPDLDSKVRLVAAVATDGQLRAILRRMVRRYAPPPSRRPADLRSDRTVPDLPPLAILPLDPTGKMDLAAQLGLPRTPTAVAAAVLSDRIKRLDLLRNDGGSVTVDGALVGGADEVGRALPWHGRIEVDDAVLSDGTDPILACAIGNGAGYAQFDGLPLLTEGDPTDGRVEVAVAVPVVVKQRFTANRVRVEVRRARGRAVSVLPRDGELQFLDDGVAGTMTRKRSWWTEPGAWAVYAG